MNNCSLISKDNSGWEQTIVLICSTCSRQFEGTSFESCSDKLKSSLKILTKNKFGRDVRVVTTSCQNICPKDKIIVTKITSNETDVFAFYEVAPDISSDELFQDLFKI